MEIRPGFFRSRYTLSPEDVRKVLEDECLRANLRFWKINPDGSAELVALRGQTELVAVGEMYVVALDGGSD